MTPCSVFAGDSLPIDATMSGCPGREETAHLAIFLLPLFLFSLPFLMCQMACGYPVNSAKQTKKNFVCLLYFPQGNILYWSRNPMSNNSFKTVHLTSAFQAIFCLFICMSFKHHDHRGLCYYCQCLGKEMKTEVMWLLMVENYSNPNNLCLYVVNIYLTFTMQVQWDQLVWIMILL